MTIIFYNLLIQNINSVKFSKVSVHKSSFSVIFNIGLWGVALKTLAINKGQKRHFGHGFPLKRVIWVLPVAIFSSVTINFRKHLD